MDKFEKLKKAMAIVCLIIIAVCVITTLVFAILWNSTKNPFFQKAWIASLFCMVIFPCVLWAMFTIYKWLKGRGEKKTQN